MPIYEFRCGACGEQFEALVDAGTASAECRRCGVQAAERVLSPQAAPSKLVGTPATRRRQERANRALRAKAKADFKAARSRRRKGPE